MGDKEAPRGYVGTPEAARLLGVTPQTVRNRVRARTLKGKEVLYEARERRYYVERASLDLELSRRGQVARYETIADYSQTLADHFTRQAKMILDAIEAQRVASSKRLESMEHNQKEIAAKLDEAVEVLREAAAREKTYQERVLDMMERYNQQNTQTDHGT